MGGKSRLSSQTIHQQQTSKEQHQLQVLEEIVKEWPTGTVANTIVLSMNGGREQSRNVGRVLIRGSVGSSFVTPI